MPANTLGERLRLARKNKGLTRRVVASTVGITIAALDTYEGGHRHPKIPTLVNLAKMYGVSLDYLLGASTFDDPPEIVTWVPLVRAITDGKMQAEGEPVCTPHSWMADLAILVTDPFMALAGILPGDIAVVRKQPAKSGDIVAVRESAWNGRPSIRYYFAGDYPELRIAHPFAPKEPLEAPEAIMGVVVKVIHKPPPWNPSGYPEWLMNALPHPGYALLKERAKAGVNQIISNLLLDQESRKF